MNEILRVIVDMLFQSKWTKLYHNSCFFKSLSSVQDKYQLKVIQIRFEILPTILRKSTFTHFNSSPAIVYTNYKWHPKHMWNLIIWKFIYFIYGFYSILNFWVIRELILIKIIFTKNVEFWPYKLNEIGKFQVWIITFFSWNYYLIKRGFGCISTFCNFIPPTNKEIENYILYARHLIL